MPKYYDHENAYRRIVAAQGTGWDDLNGKGEQGSYTAVDAFLTSPRCPPPGAALDLGCGGGQVSLRLAERGHRVTGVDFAPSAIELARANARAANLEATFLVGDITDLADLPSGTFDLALDNHALHCLVTPADRAAFLQEVCRVLKPGGTFFSETMSCEGALDHAAYGIDPESQVNRNGNRIWIAEPRLRAELEAAGLVLQHLERRPQDDVPPTGDLLVTISARQPR